MKEAASLRRLEGSVAIVTGASSGIGSAVAEAYAEEGARVVVNYSRNRAGAEATAARIAEAGGEAVVVQADVSRADDVRAMVEETHRTLGSVNILVNNAARLPSCDWSTQTEEGWDDTLDVNVKGHFLCTRAVAEDMIANRYGKIIGVSSVVFVQGYKAIDYTSSKAAIVGFTRSMASVLGLHNICINAILPGLILPGDDAELDDTKHPWWDEDQERRQVLDRQILKRPGRPRFTVGAFVFLASHESDFITGSCLAVDGGYTRY